MKDVKYLNEEGLLFFTQVIKSRLEGQIKDAIDQAVADVSIPADSRIITRINTLLEDGTIANKAEFDEKITALKADIEQAKADAVTDAIAQFNANVESLTKQYAKEYVDSVSSLTDAEKTELTESVLASDAFTAVVKENAATAAKEACVDKTGDTMTGALTVTGDVTGTRFVTSSGIIFF